MTNYDKPEEAYSLHRYLGENGLPDYDLIFSEGKSSLWILNHLDSWLLGHLDNQPEIVREDKHVRNHIRDCEKCRGRLDSRSKETGQEDLPF